MPDSPNTADIVEACDRIEDVLDDPERIDFDTGILEVFDLRLLVETARAALKDHRKAP